MNSFVGSVVVSSARFSFCDAVSVVVKTGGLVVVVVVLVVTFLVVVEGVVFLRTVVL